MCKQRKKFVISDKIKHLSSGEIDDIYERYLNGEKNSFLIKEYNIDVKPNVLISILPPKILYEKLCAYCNVPMLTKRLSKKSGSCSTPLIECYDCDHKIYPENSRYYNKVCCCIPCVEAREVKSIEVEREDKNKVLLKYDLRLVEPVKYIELSLFHKLVLLTIFRIQTDEDFEHIKPLDSNSKNDSLSPTREMDIKCLEELHDCRVIVVDPKSEITAFSKDNDFNSYYISQVRWIPNVALNEQNRVSLGELYKEIYEELKGEVKLEWKSEIYETLFLISQEEVLKYIHVKANELSVEFTAEVKTRDIVVQLLMNFSVSEIYYFAHKAVESAHLYYKKGFSKGKKHAANTIPTKMLSLGERSIAEGWSRYQFNRDSRVPRSYISKVFYDFFLKDDDAGFDKSPVKYWNESIYLKYFYSFDSVKEKKLHCSQCSSTNIVAEMSDIDLKIVCKDCKCTNNFISND